MFTLLPLSCDAKTEECWWVGMMQDGIEDEAICARELKQEEEQEQRGHGEERRVGKSVDQV